MYEREIKRRTDIMIVGSGCSGLFAALHLPKDKQITIITKSKLEESDSFLAQGGICVLKEEGDYASYYEDTMRAGHYENDEKSVELMLQNSPSVIQQLVSYGVSFQRKENGEFAYTREGAHTQPRILFHKDITGREITSHLLQAVKKLHNVTLLENTTLVDIVEKKNVCYGAVVRTKEGELEVWKSGVTILATGGIGGIYKHSTNFSHLTGDAIAIALRHKIRLKNIDYVQIHPTTLYTGEADKRVFLISESVRGEGAKLYNKKGERFANELLPRDLLTEAIQKQMREDGTKFVWEDMRPITRKVLEEHFPNIIERCQKAGYDPFHECIPVVPAQHYFMGGIWVDYESKTSMEHLYAVGETACNGVHGRNRLASNSLLESLVFAECAANAIAKRYQEKSLSSVDKVSTNESRVMEMIQTIPIDFEQYADKQKLEHQYRTLIIEENMRQKAQRKEMIWKAINKQHKRG